MVTNLWKRRPFLAFPNVAVCDRAVPQQMDDSMIRELSTMIAIAVKSAKDKKKCEIEMHEPRRYNGAVLISCKVSMGAPCGRKKPNLQAAY